MNDPIPPLVSESLPTAPAPAPLPNDQFVAWLRRVAPYIHAFRGKTFVITGTLQTMTREEAKARLQSLGAKVSSSVSKKTTALIVGGDPGSKLQAALSLNVEPWSEEQLRRSLGEA